MTLNLSYACSLYEYTMISIGKCDFISLLRLPEKLWPKQSHEKATSLKFIQKM